MKRNNIVQLAGRLQLEAVRQPAPGEFVVEARLQAGEDQHVVLLTGERAVEAQAFWRALGEDAGRSADGLPVTTLGWLYSPPRRRPAVVVERLSVHTTRALRERARAYLGRRPARKPGPECSACLARQVLSHDRA